MIASGFAALARLACGCQARWQSPPPAPGPRVYFANHSSHLDPLMIWAALPETLRRRTRIVAAADYWQGGPLRRWVSERVFRAVLIERHNVSRANNPLAAMRRVLDDGEALVIFPEGGRGACDDLRAFQGGIWHLARNRPDLELTPVWLENLGRMLPKGESLPIPLMTAVTFGAPERWTPEIDKPAFLDRLRTRLCDLRETRDA